MSNKSDNICVVCFKNVVIYSIGCCDHNVCFECSTRMRVLCRQNECPICRQDMQLVVFTLEVKPFAEIKNSTRLLDKKYNIAFSTPKIQDAFYKLLEHNCSICKSKTFKNFQDLSDHMRRAHDLFYCDLCVENLKILTSERRCYNRSELALHRRKGDPDDKSHRGHPLCEFCETRYMDNDDLYRHLRRDHLYCHFCDADGLHMYYSSYDYLRDHFRQEHFLCEEGNCIEEKFTPVFRTEIDLRAHRASEHGRQIGKVAAKQARTLEVEFTLKPRLRPQDPRRRGRGLEPGTSEREEEVAELRPEPTPPLNPSDFPTLGDGSGGSSVPLTNLAPPRGGGAYTIRTVGRKGPQYDQHFPGLPHGEVAAAAAAAPAPSTSVRLNINAPRKPGSSGNSAQPNVSIHVNHRPSRNILVSQDAFPALSAKPGTAGGGLNWVAVSKTLGNPTTQPSAGAASSNWTAVSKKTPSPAPVTPATPQPSKPREEDFPSLNAKFSANLNLHSNEPLKTNYVNIKSNLNKNKTVENGGKKATSVTIPVDKSWPAPDSPQPTKGKTKKKKKGGSEDTAKKKGESSPEKTKPEKKIRENSEPASGEVKHALVTEESKSETRPLPTAADWFGSSAAKLEEDVGPDPTEIDHVVESVLQLSRIMSSSKPKKPPPGFAPLNGYKAPPPPGFDAPQPPSNGLTFTNSSGEMFPIRTAKPYLPPADFDQRNLQLVTKVNEILLNDASLEEFRWKSAAFRRSEISAEEYFQHCLRTMGEAGMTDVLPELLVLLPDIAKQQELLAVLERHGTARTGKRRLESCTVCCQVVTALEMKQHLAKHVLDLPSYT